MGLVSAPRGCTRAGRGPQGGSGTRGQQGETTMVKRRKMLIGLGALAAGGAAATGTGAFSSARSDRSVSASVVNDDSAYLGLFDSGNNLDNEEYAKGAGSGQLQLVFDDTTEIENPGGFNNPGGAGSGLNEDSVYYFDRVFAVASKSEEQINIDVDWSGLDNPDNFYFYSKNTKPASYEFTAPSDHTNRVGNGIVAGSFSAVGVAIKTPESLDSEWETGSVSIQAESLKEVSIGEQQQS
jgi:hypothetical protein